MRGLQDGMIHVLLASQAHTKHFQAQMHALTAAGENTAGPRDQTLNQCVFLAHLTQPQRQAAGTYSIALAYPASLAPTEAPVLRAQLTHTKTSLVRHNVFYVQTTRYQKSRALAGLTACVTWDITARMELSATFASTESTKTPSDL